MSELVGDISVSIGVSSSFITGNENIQKSLVMGTETIKSTQTELSPQLPISIITTSSSSNMTLPAHNIDGQVKYIFFEPNTTNTIILKSNVSNRNVTLIAPNSSRVSHVMIIWGGNDWYIIRGGDKGAHTTTVNGLPQIT